jgi:hypothetical protein
MTLFSIVFDAIPQIQIGAEMVMEVTSRPLHFLVGTALSTMAATVICNTLPSMTCATPALLITFAPLDQCHAGRHRAFCLDLEDGAPHS